ncbi:hypothetical protein QBC45DRAFT_445722 [Copromyces sp. CBS 386.78]|nr:hypothetical protein QBC45DRAFT_445722 [Copromyces sp. CBS 386.78]
MSNFAFLGGCYYDPVTGQPVPPEQQPPSPGPEQLDMPPLPDFGPAVGIQEPEPAFAPVNNFEQPVPPAQDEDMDEWQPLRLPGSPPPHHERGFAFELDDDEDWTTENWTTESYNALRDFLNEGFDWGEDVHFTDEDEDMDSDEDEELDSAENMFQHEVYQQPVEPVMPVMPVMPTEPAAPVVALPDIQEEPAAVRRPQLGQPKEKKKFPHGSKAAKSQAWKEMLKKWEMSHMYRREAAHWFAGTHGFRLQHKDKVKKQGKKTRGRSI